MSRRWRRPSTRWFGRTSSRSRPTRVRRSEASTGSSRTWCGRSPTTRCRRRIAGPGTWRWRDTSSRVASTRKRRWPRSWPPTSSTRTGLHPTPRMRRTSGIGRWMRWPRRGSAQPVWLPTPRRCAISTRPRSSSRRRCGRRATSSRPGSRLGPTARTTWRSSGCNRRRACSRRRASRTRRLGSPPGSARRCGTAGGTRRPSTRWTGRSGCSRRRSPTRRSPSSPLSSGGSSSSAARRRRARSISSSPSTSRRACGSRRCSRRP